MSSIDLHAALPEIILTAALLQDRLGDEMRVLDISGGWAWGYGPDGRVGYVRAEAVGA